MEGQLRNQQLVRDFDKKAGVAEYLMAVLVSMAEEQVQSMTAEQFAERYGRYGTECLAKYWTK